MHIHLEYLLNGPRCLYLIVAEFYQTCIWVLVVLLSLVADEGISASSV